MDYKSDIAELMRLVTSRAEKSEVLRLARQTKLAITNEVTGLMQAVQLVDNIVAVFGPDPTWQVGWIQPMGAGPSPGSITSTGSPALRMQRTVEIARSLAAQIGGSVTSKQIAEELRREGYIGSTKDLATSAGNILARLDDWERIRPGEYRLVGFNRVNGTT